MRTLPMFRTLCSVALVVSLGLASGCAAPPLTRADMLASSDSLRVSSADVERLFVMERAGPEGLAQPFEGQAVVSFRGSSYDAPLGSLTETVEDPDIQMTCTVKHLVEWPGDGSIEWPPLYTWRECSGGSERFEEEVEFEP